MCVSNPDCPLVVRPRVDLWGSGRGACRHEGGATLLEALITLLVMSIGLLGVAALQLVGTQENASALRQSQAIWFAYDMADRMRANLAGVTAGDYGKPGSPVSTASAPNCASGACDCDASTANCLGPEMADFDLYQWGQAISQTAGTQTLPNGLGTIEDVGNGRYRVRVMWDDDVAGLNPNDPKQAARISVGCPSDDPNNRTIKTCVEITVQP